MRKGGVGQRQRGVPFGGEGGVAGAALGEGGAVDADLSRGEPGVTGAGEDGEESAVLALLSGGEGARHGA